MANQAAHEVGDIVSPETLKKLNKSELATYGRANFALDLNPQNFSAQEMIDQIMNAQRKFKGNAEFRVLSGTEEKAPEVPSGYVKIKISPGPHNPNNRPIPIGLNFRMALVPVNKEIIMHGKWLTCLQDAVQRKFFVSKQPDGSEELDWTDEHKYPYHILVDNR